MISQSGLLCNSLSFRGLRPQRLMRPSPGGGCFSEEGSSERLFYSLSGWACSAGLLFPRRKSRQKGASPLRAGPRLLSNRI